MLLEVMHAGPLSPTARGPRPSLLLFPCLDHRLADDLAVSKSCRRGSQGLRRDNSGPARRRVISGATSDILLGSLGPSPITSTSVSTGYPCYISCDTSLRRWVLGGITHFAYLCVKSYYRTPCPS